MKAFKNHTFNNYLVLMCVHTSQYGKLNRIDIFFHMTALEFPTFSLFLFLFLLLLFPQFFYFPYISTKIFDTCTILGAMQFSSFPLNGPFQNDTYDLLEDISYVPCTHAYYCILDTLNLCSFHI